MITDILFQDREFVSVGLGGTGLGSQGNDRGIL